MCCASQIRHSDGRCRLINFLGRIYFDDEGTSLIIGHNLIEGTKWHRTDSKRSFCCCIAIKAPSTKWGREFDLRYTVHLATSGSQALKALAEVPIDIFVSSQDLPGMSGLEALREAKKRSPQTHGILLTNATADEGEAFADNEEAFQIVRGDVTGEALVELVDNASQQMQLPLLSKPANDTTAHDTTARVDSGAEHIVMETADDGSSIISQSSVRLRALNVKSSATVALVDVLVLTTDAEFLETIRSSSNNMHKVHSAATLPEAEDIIRNHKVGVAIVDAAIVRDKIEQPDTVPAPGSAATGFHRCRST